MCAGRHHCSSDHSISPWTEEPILAGRHPKLWFSYGPSSWMHLGRADVAEKKPVPNCISISSSVEQEAIANQMLIKWKQALELEK